jgi:regulator of protease activity HflC (stomatin/prohibitin superfamily)
LNASEKILSREYQDIKIVAILYWRVSDPNVAFTAVEWDPRSSDFVEKILSTATEAIIRTTCAGLEIEKILKERWEIIKLVGDQLLNLTKDWGLVIESLEIIEVTVLDADLKRNMEAVKKIQEEQKARLASADAQEIYRMREIEVERKVGVTKQEAETEVNVTSKRKEVSTQTEENHRMIIEAEAVKKTSILRAEAEAEAIRLKKFAEFKAEADGILQRMNAQAEGLQKQVAALSSGDANFIMLKLIEAMPQIYANLKPEKMLITGDSNSAFGGLVKSIIPFLEILPQYSKTFEDVVKNIAHQNDPVLKQK